MTAAGIFRISCCCLFVSKQDPVNADKKRLPDLLCGCYYFYWILLYVLSATDCVVSDFVLCHKRTDVDGLGTGGRKAEWPTVTDRWQCYCNWYSRLKEVRREGRSWQLAVHSLVVERRECFERTQLAQEGDYWNGSWNDCGVCGVAAASCW